MGSREVASLEGPNNLNIVDGMRQMGDELELIK